MYIVYISMRSINGKNFIVTIFACLCITGTNFQKNFTLVYFLNNMYVVDFVAQRVVCICILSLLSFLFIKLTR